MSQGERADSARHAARMGHVLPGSLSSAAWEMVGDIIPVPNQRRDVCVHVCVWTFRQSSSDQRPHCAMLHRSHTLSQPRIHKLKNFTVIFGQIRP